MKRFIALPVLFVLLLAGCAEQDGDAAAAAQADVAENPQLQALEQAREAGLLTDKAEEPALLTAHEAANLLTEALDADAYEVALTDIQLEVGESKDGAHAFFVFDVQTASGSAVGQAAVDRQTGETYRYLGEGTLDDFETLRQSDAGEECDWAGEYESPVSVGLEILQGDPHSFEYRFSDGTAGNAGITGSTAKSQDGEMNFLYSDDIVTVVGGGMTGNYARKIRA